MRLTSISIDLDEIHCYTAIHGLGAPPEEARWAIYRHALPRLEALLNHRGIRATWFVVGRDLQHPLVAKSIKRLHHAGHEIANHSHDHHYDLTRLPAAEIERQVDACSQAIADVIGTRPIGFRAPGYTLNEALLDVLQGLDLAYDSSVFPCPSYYLAKGAVIGAMRLRGRRSHSVLSDPRDMLAPANPYRVGRTLRTRGEGILELPIGVTTTATGRLPYIGTSLVMAGPQATRALTQAIAGRPLINLELHGIDLADAEPDGLGFLRAHQPDLNVRLDRKLASLHGAIDSLVKLRYRFVTLAEATSYFGRPQRAVH